MSSLEILKTLPNRTKEIITPKNDQPFARTKDGFSITRNPEDQINITLGNHKS